MHIDPVQQMGNNTWERLQFSHYLRLISSKSYCYVLYHFSEEKKSSKLIYIVSEYKCQIKILIEFHVEHD